MPTSSLKAHAMRLIVCFGLVSMFADMTYEGARSITGPFLGSLGASASAVAFLAGLGELLGYGLRFFSGILADRTRSYWLLTMLGYGVNVVAVPLMAIAPSWEMVALLVVLERTGKSLRAPARDVMLSNAASEVGTGWGFGLHAAMDQLGAFIGPLFVAATYARTQDYRFALGWLVIPALCAMAALYFAWASFPQAGVVAPSNDHPEEQARRPREFWIYMFAAGCVAAGFVDFALAGFHMSQSIAGGMIPIYYAGAMAMNAFSALALGRLYDRFGLIVLPMAIVVASLAVPCLFWGWSLWGAVALWGFGMGAFDSVLKAGVAKLAPMHKRGAAYGIFNGVFGILWFAGSSLMGQLYGGPWLVWFGLGMQSLGALLFLWLALHQREA